ncbi:short-chain dehydrogenase TIC 32 B, chloroplastic-like [Triticum dicoccoides]|uniref:short-chain dehydrogenase TIC 32 B, chloroplastic-like n=1 Tax=Triticum dicoccoides TaxID=85692 RepID=UPI00188DDE9B|nr:short-chain dehydrogenase TIC 32 B, chloroplastic-like [Triticum dicoccoides]
MLQEARYLLGSPCASGFGSKSTAEEVTASCPDLGSLTAIITGATSGIGAETARVLAKRGARVVIPARSVKAAEDMHGRILGKCPGADILVLHLDLSSLASVREFARRFLSLGLPLHLLINNAGKFSHGQLALSEDGVEMTFATNYLGHFLLTKLLLGRMVETAAATGVQGRIVNVSSSVHGWFPGDWSDYRIASFIPASPNAPYDATQAYAVSKLAKVLHTKELATRLQEMGADVTVNCVHPGIVRTRLNRDREGLVTDLVFVLLSKLLKTIPQAAATTCYAAVHPRLAGVSGRYLADCNEALPSPAAESRSEAARLWQASEATSEYPTTLLCFVSINRVNIFLAWFVLLLARNEMNVPTSSLTA